MLYVYLRNLDAVLVEMSPSEIDMMLEALDTNFTLPSPIKQQSHSQSLQSHRDARTGSRHRGNSLGESDLKKPNRSQSIVQTNPTNMTTSLKGDRKGSFDKSPSDATSDHITPAKPTYNRDRALSKDLDSIDSVKRYIRAVKKKLASIADIEQKLLSSSPPPTTLNPTTSPGNTTDDQTSNNNAAFTMQTTLEQQEKLGRKGACQSELKRLQLILTRLEREETSKPQAASFGDADCKDTKSGSIDFLTTPQLSPAVFSNNPFQQHSSYSNSGASQMRIVEPPKGFEAWTTMVSPSKSREARLAAAEGKGSRSSSVADLQVSITSSGGASNMAKPNSAPVSVNVERTKAAYTDSNPSLSTVGKGGRTVLSPPAPALTTPQKPSPPMAASLPTPPSTPIPVPSAAVPPSQLPLSSPFFSAKPAASTAAYVTPKKPSQPNVTATFTSTHTPIITNPLTIVAPIGKVSGVSLSSFLIQSSVAKEPVTSTPTPKPPTPLKNPWALPTSSPPSTAAPASIPKPSPATPATPLNKQATPTDTRSIPNTKPPHLPSPPTNTPHIAPHPAVATPKKSLVEIQREEERLHTSLFTQRNCIVDRFESAWSVGVTKGNHTTTMKQLLTAQEEETLRDEQCRRDEELARQIAQEEQMYNNIHTGKRGHKGGNQGKGKKGNNNREKANKT